MASRSSQPAAFKSRPAIRSSRLGSEIASSAVSKAAGRGQALITEKANHPSRFDGPTFSLAFGSPLRSAFSDPLRNTLVQDVLVRRRFFHCFNSLEQAITRLRVVSQTEKNVSRGPQRFPVSFVRYLVPNSVV